MRGQPIFVACSLQYKCYKNHFGSSQRRVNVSRHAYKRRSGRLLVPLALVASVLGYLLPARLPVTFIAQHAESVWPITALLRKTSASLRQVVSFDWEELSYG
jgi:hypothetical protein